jgi:hypothetical protein
MKRIQWLLAGMAAVTLVVTGCKKDQSLPTDTVQVNGVSVDMPKLMTAFSASTNSELRKTIFEVDQGFRYRDYVRCLMALEQLSNAPDIDANQKKIVGEVSEQVKKLANAPAPTPPPGQ